MTERRAYAPGEPCWIDLGTPDLPGSRSFYEGLLGWVAGTADDEHGGYTVFTLDGAEVAGVLDPAKGGRFSLEPEVGYEATRRYAPDTNVLETTFTTSEGSARVTDGLLFHGPGLTPLRELVRVIDGLSGTTPFRWSVEPRFGYGAATTTVAARGGVAIASAGADAIAIRSFDAGTPAVAPDRISGRVDVPAGSTAVLAMSSSA